MKRITLILIITALFSFESFAQDRVVTGTTSGGDFEKVGSAGAQFLKIPIGGRGVGMGGAFGSVTDDLSSIFWNPAGLSNIEDVSAYFSYTQWFAGYSHNFGALNLPLNDRFNVSLFAIGFSSPRIEETTVNQEDGTGAFYTVNDVSLGAAISGKLTEQFTFGFVAKIVRNAFQTVDATGVAFDIGTQYDTGIYGIKFGFSIHNLGAEQRYEGNALNGPSTSLNGSSSVGDGLGGSGIDVAIPAYPFSLPLIFRAGVSSMILDGDDHDFLVSADFITMSDSPEQLAMGLEYTFRDFISFRGGYYYGNDQLSFSGGIGVNYISELFNGEVEYAISPTADLGLINRINIIVDFND